jgi:xanthine dehydrogenase large subunit
VVAVFTAADIPGENNVGPVFHDDLLFAEDEILYPASRCSSSPRPAIAPPAAPRGWPGSNRAAPALVTIAEAQDAGRELEPPQRMARATRRPRSTARASPVRDARMGGQEHFYLEGQAALAIPGEQGQLHVVSSTQHPSESSI